MLDIHLLRTQPERVRDMCHLRRTSIDLDRLILLDQQVREVGRELEELRRERKQNPGPSPEARERAASLRTKISELTQREREMREEFDSLWARMPNLLAEDTPSGADDQGNVTLRTVGQPPAFDFEPKPHEQVARALGIIDFERAAKVAGSGFVYWTGDGARLAHGLFSLALDWLIGRGFTPMLGPIVARERTLFGTGYLPFFQDQIYRLADHDLALIGTSEQTLMGYRADEILQASELPLRYTAFTPCFRTEAGSHGRDSRGAFRQHQFHKVEQIVISAPEQSEHWHEQCQENAEGLLQALGVPYRVVRVCSGDLGAPAYKKYDIEAWFPGFGAYRETHSNSNLLDYQCRRLHIRLDTTDGKRVVPHSISATMVTDRVLLAILENNQRADGTVLVPEPLRRWVDGRSELRPASDKSTP
jgi:seryl-tRNA synthetase